MAAVSFVFFVDRVSDPTVAIAAARSKKKTSSVFFGAQQRSMAKKNVYLISSGASTSLGQGQAKEKSGYT